MNDINDDIPDKRLEELKDERKEMFEKYVLLCPDKNCDIFSSEAMAIVAFDDQLADALTVSKTTTNNELDRLRKAFLNLTPATKAIIKLRTAGISDDMLEKASYDNSAYSMVHEIITQKDTVFSRFAQSITHNTSLKKNDVLRAYLYRMASHLWERHGGSVTSTENDTGFVAFLDMIIDDRNQNIASLNKLSNNPDVSFESSEARDCYQKFSSGELKKPKEIKKLDYHGARMTKDFKGKSQL